MRIILPLLLAVAACHPANHEAVAPAEQNGVLRITASYPGADARTVADTVATPIEVQVDGTEGLVGLESESRNDGSYTLTVRFRDGADLNQAQVAVQNRVALAMPV